MRSWESVRRPRFSAGGRIPTIACGMMGRWPRRVKKRFTRLASRSFPIGWSGRNAWRSGFPGASEPDSPGSSRGMTEEDTKPPVATSCARCQSPCYLHVLGAGCGSPPSMSSSGSTGSLRPRRAGRRGPSPWSGSGCDGRRRRSHAASGGRRGGAPATRSSPRASAPRAGRRTCRPAGSWSGSRRAGQRPARSPRAGIRRPGEARSPGSRSRCVSSTSIAPFVPTMPISRPYTAPGQATGKAQLMFMLQMARCPS